MVLHKNKSESNVLFFSCATAFLMLPLGFSKRLSVSQSRENHIALNPISNGYGVQPVKSPVSKNWAN